VGYDLTGGILVAALFVIALVLIAAMIRSK
jgi:hypothetical protein